MSNWEQATVLTKYILSVSKNRGLFLKLPGLFQFNEILPRKTSKKKELKIHQHGRKPKTATRRSPLIPSVTWHGCGCHHPNG